MTVLLALLGCDPDDPTKDEPPVSQITDCAEVREALGESCTVCHSGTAPQGALDLTDPAALVGRVSAQAPMELVVPGEPEESYLWRKLSGTHTAAGGEGDVMPPPGSPGMPQQHRIAVQDWILAGASCEPGSTSPPPDTGPVDDSACQGVQEVVDAHCSGCHGASSLGGLDLRSLGELSGVESAQLPGMLLLAPGDRDGSYLWQKLQGTHLAAGGTGQSMPPTGPLDGADLEVIGVWLDEGASCAPGQPLDEEYDPNELDQDSLFVCDGSPSSSQARVRRLDDVEWRSTIGQTFTSPAASNPLGAPAQARFSTYAQDVGMDAATLDLYLNVVQFAGGPWTAQYADDYGRQHQPQVDGTIRCMFDDDAPDTSCIDAYLTAFLEGGAYYRPPSADELARLRTFTQDALTREPSEGWTREQTLLHVTSAAWLTTAALFPSELGDGTFDASGRTRLTDWEHARLISNLVSDRALGSQGVFRWALGPYDSYTEPAEGSMPELQQAAADGSIRDPAVAGALLRQYAAGIDPARVDTYLDWGDERRLEGRAQEWMGSRLDRFFLEWFEVEDFPIVFKDRPEATSAYDGGPNVTGVRYSYGNLQDGYYGHESTLLQQFEDTIARVVVQDQDVLRELLTTREFFLASTTRDAGSSIENSTMYTSYSYGYDEPVGNGSASDRWVTLPEDERAGMLTHPAWLSTHGDAFEDGPSMVARGHWIREHLLCQSVPPLEFVTVPALLAPTDGTKTARQRVDESIEGRGECMVCHQSMNSLGRAFEIYNHAGFLRADDHGLPPDGSTTVDNAPDPALDGTYSDAIALTEALADSPYVKRCFVRQTFRFFAGRDETLQDACVLSAMELAYDDSGGSFLAMLEALATHDSTVYRHVTEEGN